MVKILLMSDATHDPNGSGRTPLHIAAFRGHAEVVRVLLQHGATHDANNLDETPLTSACRAGHLNVAEILLEDGADPWRKDNVEYTSFKLTNHA